MKTLLNDPLKRVWMPLEGMNVVKTDETPLMFIPKDRKWIEILGHKFELDGVNDFPSFIEYLQRFKDLETIKNAYRDEWRVLLEERNETIKYLEEKIEESKLMRDYVDGKEILSIQETIYRDIRDRIVGVDSERESEG